ncbi:GNAT family N-acetyltransferase [Methanocella arvoryzae]|uniref:Acetyltransferase (GNAT family) n=1 Tax=Methanocella arvoryzae (strain DSM 22066 / NBRC 105507 / MRE50) TaxID=351160 RepID=Q0W5Y5_METAR|nr:GNAT family protein [Methanocella arvoryzae]CAJ36208.1 putative acetyltransferase (GNAT family) [Methanocella arvoryzae MRE50]
MFQCRIDAETELRLVEEQDVQEIFELIDSSREHLRPWLPWVDLTTTSEDTAGFIRRSLEQHEKNEAIILALMYRGKIAGIVSLVTIDWENEKAEMGYWIGTQYRGKGLATRACRALVTTAFEDLGLHRVEIRVATENGRSRAIAGRPGFTQDGVLREAILLYGRYHDMVVYSMLKAEWPAALSRTRPKAP